MVSDIYPAEKKGVPRSTLRVSQRLMLTILTELLFFHYGSRNFTWGNSCDSSKRISDVDML